MNQRYNKQFRTEAVRLALSGSKSIAQTARDLGVKETLLYHWISETKRNPEALIDGDKKLSVNQLIDELQKLRKDNARLREEREILKKAAVFFAKEEQSR